MTLEALRIIRGIWANPSYKPTKADFLNATNAELSYTTSAKAPPAALDANPSKDSIEEAAATGISTVQWVPSRDEGREPPSTNTARPIKETNPRDRNRTWDSWGNRRGGNGQAGAGRRRRSLDQFLGTARWAQNLRRSRRRRRCYASGRRTETGADGHGVIDWPRDRSSADCRKSSCGRFKRSRRTPARILFSANSLSA